MIALIHGPLLSSLILYGLELLPCIFHLFVRRLSDGVMVSHMSYLAAQMAVEMWVICFPGIGWTTPAVICLTK